MNAAGPERAALTVAPILMTHMKVEPWAMTVVSPIGSESPDKGHVMLEHTATRFPELPSHSVGSLGFLCTIQSSKGAWAPQ